LAEPDLESEGTVCKEVRERCKDIERQHFFFFANLSEKRSLIFYHDKKLLWDREDYVMYGSRNDRMGIAWLMAGIWKDKEGFRDWKMPLCNGEEDAIHILLKCPETRRLREHLLSRKYKDN
jgi:hypothetical protein